MKKNYDAVDLVKFIASIFVVSIHASALYDIDPMANALICEGIARLAVPFFFVASAFFYLKELDKHNDIGVLKKHCRRLITLYMAWFIVSLPITVFNRIVNSEYSFFVTMLRFIKSFFVTSTFSGSWFITSCLFCSVLYWFLEKLPERKRKVLTILLSVLAYAIPVLTSGYGRLMEIWGIQDVYEKVYFYFATPYLSIIVGIPYFALARYFAREKHKSLSKGVGITGFLLTAVLLLTEVYLTNINGLTTATDCYWMLFPCTFFLFSLAVSSTLVIPRAKNLRTASTIIYFSQFIWLFCLEFAEWALKIVIPWHYKFLIALALCFAAAYLLPKLQKRFKLLKYFY